MVEHGFSEAVSSVSQRGFTKKDVGSTPTILNLYEKVGYFSSIDTII